MTFAPTRERHLFYSTSKVWLRWTLALLTLSLAGAAWSHGYGDGYVFLRPQGEQLHVRTELQLSSLAAAVGSSPNIDQVDAHLDQYLAYIQDHLGLAQNGTALPLIPNWHGTVRINTGSFLSVAFEPLQLAQPADALEVRYSLFFDQDGAHRGVLLIQPPEAVERNSEQGEVRLIFSPERTRQTLNLRNGPELDYDIKRSGGAGIKALGLVTVVILACAMLAFILGQLWAWSQQRIRAQA